MMKSKEGKFRSKQFGCKKQLGLLTVNVLNGFYCISEIIIEVSFVS